MDIDVYRGIEKIYSLPIDERSIFVKKLMNEWYIEVETISNTALTFQIGDYITYNSENYTIYRLPDIEKINEKALRYTIQFESDMTLLNHKLFMWYGDELVDNEGVAEFDLNGTAEDFLDLVIKNINKTSSGWTKGTVDTTTEKTMSFTNEYCLEALVRIAEEFDLEFDIAAKVISLKGGIGTTTALTFEYGKGKGIYKLTRQQVQDQNILTRVYGFGSNRNIDYSYRSGLKKLIFKDGSNSYLDKNTELYGIIEGQYTNEDIYPHFEGTITAASIVFTDGVFDEESYIADSSIDFDINSYLLEGTEAKIVFTSGDLSGVECVIRKFTADADGELPANRVYFKASIDPEDSYPYPNYNGGTPIQPKVGDTFTFVDIKMPQAYIDAAELELKTATQTFLNENSVPQVVYTLDIDPKYAKTIAAFSVGDKVTVTDTQLGVDALIRISGVEFPLVNKYKIKATIADFVPYTLQERVIKSIINERKETRFVDRRRIESARINTIRQKQMKDMIFDADDYFDTVRIKPFSIETLYLAVGTKSSDFWLQGVTIHANYGGDENAIYVSGGILSHLQISIPELGADWVIGSDYTADTLADATGYYLYAKCSKSALTGEWVLSDAKIGVEDVSGYYHFYCGNLFPVLDGYRKFDFVKGMTYIVGDTITTGKIQSIDENCYLDLTNAKFRVGDSSTSLDWNVTTPSTLTIKGALVQSPAGTTFPMKVFRGAYDADTEYFKGDEVTYGGESWLYINATESTGTTPVEGAYWTKSAAKGTNGTSAMTVKLTVDRQVFSYDSSGANPSPANCTLTAYAEGISGTPYYQFLVDGASKQNTTASTYVYTPKAAFADMPDIIQVFVRSGSDSGTVLAQDMITLFGIKAAADGDDGVDAYTVVLTNEAHTLPAAYDGSVISFDGSGTDIYVFSGITPVQYGTGASTFSVSIESGDAVNVTPGSVSTEGLYIRRYADLSAMSADNGSIKFTIKVRDANNVETTITRLQSFAKSRAGTDGADGKSFENIFKRTTVETAPDTPTTAQQDDYVPTGWTDDPTGVDATNRYEWVSTRTKSGGVWSNFSTPALWSRYSIDGARGRSINFRGNFSASTDYRYNDTVQDIVKYTDDVYYLYIGTDNTHGAWNSSNWQSFGASFESIATGLLFAELAYIENLGVRHLKTADEGQRVTINGDDNNITLHDSDENEVLVIDDTIEDSSASATPRPGIKIVDPVNSKVIYVSPNGVFSNKGGMLFLPPSSGIKTNANIVGLLNQRNTDSNGYSAAIAGIDQTTSGSSKSLAGYFQGDVLAFGVMMANGFAFNNDLIYEVPDDASVDLPSTKKIFIGNNKTTNRTWYLPDPSAYKKWELIMINNYNIHDALIYPLSGDYINGYTADQRHITLSEPGHNAILMSNGSDMWLIFSLNGGF